MSNTALDIRWQQRFDNFTKALNQLKSAVLLAKDRPLSLLEEQGLIKSFEFTYQLAWNVMKDYLEFQGETALIGSRDATRAAFKAQLIEDGEMWMEMIESRNQTAHTYNHKLAQEISTRIRDRYFPLFELFQNKMELLKFHE